MIISFNRYNGGGSSSAVTPEQVQQQIDSALTPYWESAVTESAITEAVSGLATEQYVQDALSGVSLEGYWNSAQTEEAISAATSGKADAANVSTYNVRILPKWNSQGVITGITGSNLYERDLYLNGNRYVVIRAGTDKYLGEYYAPVSAGTAGEILVSTGNGAPVWSAVTMGGNSNILPAITSQAEYGAISGSVKTGDLIQAREVDINDDGEDESGLFEATVVEEEDGPGGDIIRFVYWERRDNADSVSWAVKTYPWMADNDVWPVDFGEGSFLISNDDTSEDEAYNGIGFDGDGKPVITHIVPQYDEQTGEITGMTREDRDILGELDTLDEVVATAIVDLNEKKVESQDIKHIVKLTQAEYDQLVLDDEVDPETFYIIINNNN